MVELCAVMVGLSSHFWLADKLHASHFFTNQFYHQHHHILRAWVLTEENLTVWKLSICKRSPIFDIMISDMIKALCSDHRSLVMNIKRIVCDQGASWTLKSDRCSSFKNSSFLPPPYSCIPSLYQSVCAWAFASQTNPSDLPHSQK